jgi:alanyl aminopeptidase
MGYRPTDMRAPCTAAASSLLVALALVVGACEPPAPLPAPVVPVVAPAPAPAPPPLPPEPVPSVRLPGDVRPLAQSIRLRIDPTTMRFSGTVAISLLLDKPRDVVWLHGRDLHVTHTKLTPEGGAPIDATWAEKDDGGVASLTLAKQAPAGKARLDIDYDAAFVPGVVGLYRVTQAGVAYAYTQFEPIDARRAFPCFDEPGYKIPFHVELVVPKDDAAVSNGAELSRTPAPGGTADLVTFATTPPLPTYLVAFAVGPMDVVRAPDLPPTALRPHPLPLRFFAARGRGPELAFAAARAGKIVAALEDYFGVPFPYEKLDMLAVPDREGAMENAGAITFTESCLLLDEKTASLPARAHFGECVGHESAHQWFGDLVTMAWWDDLWLNESFAEWMGYKVVDLWDPTLRAGLARAERVAGAMASDSLASARQIRQPIVSRSDISNAFDDITYGKGAGVLTMFERWLGPDVLQRGIRAHLEARRYGTATATDFLSALSKAAGKDVGAAMRTFLDQPGVPFLEAETRCDPKGARVHVTQSRYLPLASTGDPARTWQVPVCVRYGLTGGKDKERESCALVTEKEGDVPLDACPDWVMPNAGGAGYYHFALAKNDLAKLGKGFARLSPAEKLAYTDSLSASVGRGTTPMADVLGVLAPVAADGDPEVVDAASGIVGQAYDWLYRDPSRAKIEAHIRALFGPAATRLGWTAPPGEDSARTKLRRDVLWLLADRGNDPAVRVEAKRRGVAYLGKDDRMHPEAVDPNLAWLSLAVLAEDADRATFDTMLSRLTHTDDPLSRSRLISALALVKDPELAGRARGIVLEDGVLRREETLAPLYSQLGNAALRDDAWAWIATHFDALLARLKDTSFSATAVVSLPGQLCDAARADEAEKLLAPRVASVEGGARAGASAIESIRLCAARRANQEPSARSFYAHR